MLFSGRSPELAQKIGERLGVELGEVKVGSFANGETYVRFEESIRGADVFLVQTGCEPVDRNLMELLIMVQASEARLREADTAVVPWYFRARTARLAREPITARLVADMIRLQAPTAS